jgi:hypothetical protein
VRLSGSQDYYLVQLAALRDRAILSLVRGGLSEEIEGVDADIASYAWHTLTVRAKGDEFVVSLDEIWAFTAFDKTLPSATRFDSVTITPLPTFEERAMTNNMKPLSCDPVRIKGMSERLGARSCRRSASSCRRFSWYSSLHQFWRVTAATRTSRGLSKGRVRRGDWNYPGRVRPAGPRRHR